MPKFVKEHVMSTYRKKFKVIFIFLFFCFVQFGFSFDNIEGIKIENSKSKAIFQIPEEFVYNLLKNKIEENKNEFLEIRPLKSLLFNGELFIVTFLDNEGYLWCYEVRIHEDTVVFYKYLAESYKEKFNEYGIFPYIETTLYKQINSFRYFSSSIFIYDFNHDGEDEILDFSVGNGILYSIQSFDFVNNKYKWLLDISVDSPSSIPAFEFIIYNKKQGIKIYQFNNETRNFLWNFYYYDRIQQEYVQDESASSEELEQIHGSPDFFAEAGIDYTKLERSLLPSDLEGFSKPALRIWRNAIYARHGRTFKSEDLQALFNEYAWYKPDENYSDEKLTDIDKANIKLIQQFEKNKK